MRQQLALERCAAWDRMHRAYFPDYDERWHVVIELVREHAASLPHVLDLGCGPGTLTRRLAAGVSGNVLGVDADPLLIMLARWASPPEQPVLFHRAHVGTSGAHALLRRLGPFDAIVSSAFVHYFSAAELARLHRAWSALLASGGILITAERFAGDIGAQGQPTDAATDDPWTAWWSRTRELLARRPVSPSSASAPQPISVDEYLDIAARAGLRPLTAVNTGTSHVIALSR